LNNFTGSHPFACGAADLNLYRLLAQVLKVRIQTNGAGDPFGLHPMAPPPHDTWGQASAISSGGAISTFVWSRTFSASRIFSVKYPNGCVVGTT
jgi:hypothetical protein